MKAILSPEWPAPSASNIQNWPKPGPSNIQNNQRRLSIGRRMSRAFARYAIVLLIGIGATLAWLRRRINGDGQDGSSVARLVVARLEG